MFDACNKRVHASAGNDMHTDRAARSTAPCSPRATLLAWACLAVSGWGAILGTALAVARLL
jgi:hypothetical protein